MGVAVAAHPVNGGDESGFVLIGGKLLRLRLGGEYCADGFGCLFRLDGGDPVSGNGVDRTQEDGDNGGDCKQNQGQFQKISCGGGFFFQSCSPFFS